MGECDISLQTSSTNVKLGSAEESTLKDNYIDVIKNLIQKLPEQSVSKDVLDKQDLMSLLIDLSTSSDIMDIKSYGDSELGTLWPNFTMDQIKEKFPKIPFGKKEYPILLVDDNRGIDILDGVFNRRVKIGSGYVYIVPIHNIKSFANYTIFSDTIADLKDKYNKYIDPQKKAKLKLSKEEKSWLEALQVVHGYVLENWGGWIKDREEKLQNNMQDHLERVKKEALKQTTEKKEKKINKLKEDFNNAEAKYNALMQTKNSKYPQNFQPKNKEEEESFQELEEKINNAFNKKEEALSLYNNANRTFIKAKNDINAIENGTYSDERTKLIDTALRRDCSSSFIQNQINKLEIELKNEEKLIEKYLIGSSEYEKHNKKIAEIKEQLNKKQASLEKRNDEFAKKIKSTETKINAIKDNPMDLIDYFLNNYKECSETLPIEIFNMLYRICDDINRGRITGNNKNPDVSAIRDCVRQVNNQSYIELKEIKKLIENKREEWGVPNGEITNEVVHQVLQSRFFQLQRQYSFSELVGDRVILKKYSSINDTLGIQGDTLIGVTPMIVDGDVYTRHGNFLYEVYVDDDGHIIKPKGKKSKYKPYYFWNNSLLNTYSYGRVFDSIEEAENWLDKKFPNENLSENSTKFVFQEQGSFEAIRSPQDRIYHKGDIIKALNVKYGPVKINSNFTVNDFWSWLEKTFSEEDAAEIKEELESIDQMVAFYSYYGTLDSYNISSIVYGNTSTYDQIRNKALEKAEEIANAEYKYYMVNSDTTTIDTGSNWGFKTYHTSITEMTSPNITENAAVHIADAREETTTTFWSAVSKAFNDAGIRTEVLSDKEIKERFGGNAENKVLRGFKRDGIIYINRDYATLDTPFHEFTHLLFAIIGKSKPENIKMILSQYAKLKGSKDPEGFKNEYTKYYLLYQEALKIDGTPDLQNLNLEVLEEMFCDEYGAYLKGRLMIGKDIFKAVTTEVAADHSIFDDLTEGDLIKSSSSSVFSFFSNFSERVNIARGKTGMTIPIDTALDDSITKLINSKIKDVKDLNSQNNEEGILRKCD